MPTKKELREELDAEGITVSSDASKAELEAALQEKNSPGADPGERSPDGEEGEVFRKEFIVLGTVSEEDLKRFPQNVIGGARQNGVTLTEEPRLVGRKEVEGHRGRPETTLVYEAKGTRTA